MQYNIMCSIDITLHLYRYLLAPVTEYMIKDRCVCVCMRIFINNDVVHIIYIYACISVQLYAHLINEYHVFLIFM